MSGVEVAGTVIGLYKDLQTTYKGYHTLPEHIRSKISKYPLHHEIEQAELLREVLKEVADNAIRLPQPSKALTSLLSDCVERWRAIERRFQEIVHMIERKSKSMSRGVLFGGGSLDIGSENTVGAFRDSLFLLYHLSSNALLSHELYTIKSSIQEMGAIMEARCTPFEACRAMDSGNHPEYDLRHSLENGVQSARAGPTSPSKLNQAITSSSESDRFVRDLVDQNFTFTIIIAARETDGVKETVVRAKMDTGSEAFLVERRVADRAGLTPALKNVDVPTSLKGIGESVHEVYQYVDVTWFIPNQAQSRTDRFYLVEDEGFDVLVPNTLGREHRKQYEDSTFIKTPGTGREERDERRVWVLGTRYRSKVMKEEEREKKNEAQEIARREDLMRSERKRNERMSKLSVAASDSSIIGQGRSKDGYGSETSSARSLDSKRGNDNDTQRSSLAG